MTVRHEDGPLAGFTDGHETYDGVTRRVLRSGSGPGVVVIHEVPGITPEVAAFGRRVADAGFTAVLPSLFGQPGRDLSAPYMARSLAHVCVAREFTVLATGRASPITDWLRTLARAVHAECGGPGVGVVGMCATGGFALAMAVDDEVLAPVLSQPAFPLPLGRSRRRGLDTSDEALDRVRQRVDEEDLCVLGLRFTADGSVPTERFERLREALGDGFVAVEIDSSPGNPHGFGRMAHSVLTREFVDEPGHPTRDALDRVLALFADRLQT